MKKASAPKVSRAAKKFAVRAGMPAADSVCEVVEKVSPTGTRFRILKTKETDSYDKAKRPVRGGGK